MRIHTLARFGAQLGQRRCRLDAAGRVWFWSHIAQVPQRARARHEQIAYGQLGQLEVGVVARQAFCLCQGFPPAPFGYQLVDRHEAGLRLAVTQLCRRGGDRGRGGCCVRSGRTPCLGALRQGGRGQRGAQQQQHRRCGPAAREGQGREHAKHQSAVRWGKKKARAEGAGAASGSMVNRPWIRGRWSSGRCC